MFTPVMDINVAEIRTKLNKDGGFVVYPSMKLHENADNQRQLCIYQNPKLSLEGELWSLFREDSDDSICFYYGILNDSSLFKSKKILDENIVIDRSMNLVLFVPSEKLFQPAISLAVMSLINKVNSSEDLLNIGVERRSKILSEILEDMKLSQQLDSDYLFL